MGNFDRGGNKGGGFNKGGFGGGKPSFQKKSWDNDKDRDRMMFKATCAECGKHCEVPFRPTSGKPVFCNDCFGTQRDNDTRGGRDFNDRGPRREFNGDRPAFRPEGARPPHPVAPPHEETKQQFAEMNAKLDRLITVMEKMTVAPAATKNAAAVTASNVATPKAETVKVSPKKEAAKKAAPAAKTVAKKSTTTPAAKKTAAKAPAKKAVTKKK